MSDEYRIFILKKILMIPVILLAFTVHEYAHAKVADKLGDKTPRLQGRITFNPFAHVDIIGFIMVLIMNFGWAKPVETNPRAYKDYYKDNIKVSIAGPIANLITAFIFTLIYGIINNHIFQEQFGHTINNIIFFSIYIIQITIILNVTLFLFNLLPIPGLDGFHVLTSLFPRFFNKYYDIIQGYQMVIIALFIVPLPIINTSIISLILQIPTQYILKLFFGIASFI